MSDDEHTDATETAPYLAANGHTMVAPTNNGRTQYWAATCVKNCDACSAGDTRPDW